MTMMHRDDDDDDDGMVLIMTKHRFTEFQSLDRTDELPHLMSTREIIMHPTQH